MSFLYKKMSISAEPQCRHFLIVIIHRGKSYRSGAYIDHSGEKCRSIFKMLLSCDMVKTICRRKAKPGYKSGYGYICNR